MTVTQSSNTVWHHATVTPERRARQNGHAPCTLWFTGLSGAGKSTLAHAVEEELHSAGCRTFVLDGDNVRHGLCGDLGFSSADRRENIRRVIELARLMNEAGLIVLTAFISPFREDRARARQRLDGGRFIEIYCAAPLEICEQRDAKGLYRRARAGEVPEFTGISSPYDTPTTPELTIDTATQALDVCVGQVLGYLRAQGLVSATR